MFLVFGSKISPKLQKNSHKQWNKISCNRWKHFFFNL